MYENGEISGNPDYVKANKNYNLILQQDIKERSKIDLGLVYLKIIKMFHDGHLKFKEGINSNDEILRSYGAAIHYGNIEAYYCLGKFYEEKLKNDTEAIRNYTTAAAKGYQEAQTRLETLSIEGKYVPINKEAMNGLIQTLTRDSYYQIQGFSAFFQETYSDDYPFKLSQLIVTELNNTQAPEYIKGTLKIIPDIIYRPIYKGEKYFDYEDSILAIDPSGTGKDETAYCVMKRYKGTYYITDVGGLEGKYKNMRDGTSKKVCEKLIEVSTRQNVKMITVEKNAAQGFANFLKDVGGETFENKVLENSASIDKNERILSTLKPLLNKGRLIISTKSLQDDFDSEPKDDIKHKFFYQFTSFNMQERKSFKRAMPHDDRLDAVAMAASYLRSNDPNKKEIWGTSD